MDAATDIEFDGAESGLVTLQCHGQGTEQPLGRVESHDQPLGDGDLLLDKPLACPKYVAVHSAGTGPGFPVDWQHQRSFCPRASR